MLKLLARLRIDPYLLVLFGVIALANFAPVRGVWDRPVSLLANAGIALLFFLQGARLPREAVIAGMAMGRLHLTILASTYVLFPLMALAINATGLVPEPLRPGVFFLACLPTTIQSSIALISVARGNVAAGICAASLSNLLAVALTPLYIGILLNGPAGDFSWGTLRAIVVQLLAPFILGQVLRPLIGAFVARQRRALGYVDRGSLLLVIYVAFSHAAVLGVWDTVKPVDIAILIVVAAIFFCVAVVALTLAVRALKLDKAEEITAVICGAQKSLATGAPMAGLLFGPAGAAVMILPLMVFHQLQLVATTFLAQRYARRDDRGALRSPEV